MTETSRRRARRLFAVAAACAAAARAPALAAPDQLSLIEDEKLMLESGPAVQAQALDEAKALGADVIRANVIWSRFAPSPDVDEEAQGLRRQEPDAYPAGVIRRCSTRFVAGAQARGHAGAADADRADPGLGVALQGLGRQRAASASPTRSSSARSCARSARATRP